MNKALWAIPVMLGLSVLLAFQGLMGYLDYLDSKERRDYRDQRARQARLEWLDRRERPADPGRQVFPGHRVHRAQ